MAKVFSQDLTFNPSVDTLITPVGERFQIEPPAGDSLPGHGYLDSDSADRAPPTGDRSGLSY